MRVLQINATYGFGSTGLIVRDIDDTLKRNGVESFVAFSDGEKQDNCYKFFNAVDKKRHALYTRLFGKQGYYSKDETKKFLAWVDRVRPDIVHLHNLHANYINLPMLLKYLAKHNIATVVTMHDCWYFTGKCTHYISSGCDRFMHHCGKCPMKYQAPGSIFFDKSKKVLLDKEKYFSAIRNLTLVGCSKWIADECKKSRLKNCKITVIRNGIDSDVFKPSKNDFKKYNGLDGKFLIVGFANKLTEKRNKKAVDKIIKSLTENDRLVVVGCTKENIRHFSKYKNVIPVGFISDRHKLADVYSSCDVFVNLTHADTLPTVNMESICCGTPVITYNVTGSPELIDRGSGFVVDEDDYKAIIDKIAEVKKGFFVDYNFYRGRFDKATNYMNYLTLYRGILKNR